jgi:broad specificity phosphatase PhoE
MVRHGPTHAKTMVGWTDLPADLSDVAAITRLSQHLPQDAVIISSDLQRATATADAVSAPENRLAHDVNLREIHFGDWEMCSWADIDAKDPQLIRAFWENPGHVRPPNGESWNQLRDRCDTAIDRLIQTNKGRDIVVVCHFGVIITQVQRAEQLSTDAAFGHKIDNLSVTEFTIRNGKWQMGRINHNP